MWVKQNDHFECEIWFAQRIKIEFISYVYPYAQHLNDARQCIDQAISSMKLNVTRSLAQDVATIAATVRPLSMTTQQLPENGNGRRSLASQPPRSLNGRNASQVTANGNLITNQENMLKSAKLIALFVWVEFYFCSTAIAIDSESTCKSR